MHNPYATTFMIATRMDNARLYEFDAQDRPRAAPRPARRRLWRWRR